MFKFDDLKKMGEDLIDSAKSVKLHDVIDKFKKKEVILTDAAAQQVAADLQQSIQTLFSLQKSQAETVQKLQQQMTDLLKFIEHSQSETNSQGTPTNESER